MTADGGLAGRLLRHPSWGRLRGRLYHKYFLLRRAMTLGVRGLVHDRAGGTVLLVRHTYVGGWHLPGGGVEIGQTAEEALARECEEEANIRLTGAPVLKSMHFNRIASPRDHVAFFLVEGFVQTAPKLPDREIAEARFFPLADLPAGTTASTRQRIAEALGGAPPSPYW
jgi:8-oxo-dGTP pyrophosphatase MutT (NUDIX family)